MAIRKLDKSTWASALDVMSQIAVGKRAEIEIASAQLGTHIEAQWLPLLGITYDAKNDVVAVALDDLDHVVHAPREMYVDDNTLWLSSLEIIDNDGVEHIIKLRDPLMLPSR